MWKYWSGYEKLCVEKGLNLGPTMESSTMKMLQLTALSVKKPLIKESITEIKHPPCSPGLALNDS
jgi:hypothetical protein